MRASRQKMPTNRTPGHTMKVSEDAKARFAVLGQALTRLAGVHLWVQVLGGASERESQNHLNQKTQTMKTQSFTINETNRMTCRPGHHVAKRHGVRQSSLLFTHEITL